MKIKQKKPWNRRTPAQQRARAYQIIGGLIWIALPIAGIASICAYGAADVEDEIPVADAVTSLQETADEALSTETFGRDAVLSLVSDSVSAMGGFQLGEVYLAEDRLLEVPEALDTEALLNTAEQVNALYAEYQIPMCIIAVPAATEFYADTLDGVAVTSQLEDIDLFYQAMDTSVRTIDVYHTLYTMTDNYIYNRTDPRWTAYGSYCVYRVAIQKMGFSPVSFDQYTVSHVDTYRGSLYDACLCDQVTADTLDVYLCESGVEVTSMIAYTEDDVEERELYEEYNGSDPYAYYLGEDCAQLIIETDVGNDKTLLILKDSYADCMIPFFIQHYSEICVVDITCLEQDLTELVDMSAYQQVLVVCDADTFTDAEAFSHIY